MEDWDFLMGKLVGLEWDNGKINGIVNGIVNWDIYITYIYIYGIMCNGIMFFEDVQWQNGIGGNRNPIGIF